MKYTVEQIHEEFDSAEDRILTQCNSLLKELNIPTETQIERKAEVMKKLGFVNSETVAQAENLQKNSIVIKDKIQMTEGQINNILDLKQKYPLDKFITVDELNRICEKYSLIHAPAANYIKDIPEKNVLEMANRKSLENENKYPKNEYIFKALSFHKDSIHKNYLKNKEIILHIDNYDFQQIQKNDFDADILICKLLNLETPKKGINTAYRKGIISKVDKSGIFIAAPKSHFNLKGLNKNSKFGFFNITITEVNDPIGFEYCKNDIIRIITKWGTDDDQSYLDSSLTNEIYN